MLLTIQFIQVLGVTCVESKAAYEKTKGPCTDPSISDVAGAPVSSKTDL